MATYTIPGTNLTVNINDNQGGQANANLVSADLALAATNSPSFVAAINAIAGQYQNVNINFVNSSSTLNTQFSSSASSDGKNYNINVSTNSSVSVSDGSSSRMVTFIDGVTHELFHSIAPGEQAKNYSPASQESDEAFVRNKTSIVEHELENAGVASYNNVYDNTRTEDFDNGDEGIPYLSGGVVPFGSGVSGVKPGATHRFDDYIPNTDAKDFDQNGDLTSEETQSFDKNGNLHIDVNGKNIDIELDDDQAGADLNIGNNTTGNIRGLGDTISYAANTRGDVYGNNNTVILQGNTGDHLGINGTGEVVTGDSGSNHVNLQGDGSTATIDGGGVVGLTGSNQTLTLGDQGSTVQTAPGDQGETIIGSGEAIDALGYLNAGVSGNNDTVNLAANTGSGIGVLNGSGEILNNTDGNFSVLYGAGASETTTGAGQVYLTASNESVGLNSSGVTVTVMAGVQGESITGSGETIDAQGYLNAGVSGNNDTVNLAANTGSGIGVLNGSGEVLNNTDGNFSVLYGTGVSETTDGTGSVYLTASNESVALNSSGVTVTTTAGVQGERITGSGETIDAQGYLNAGVSGNNDTVNLAANTGSGIGVVNGSGEVLNNTDGNFSVLYGTGVSETTGGTGSVYLTAANESVALNSSGVTVTASAGAQGESVTGSGETVTFAANASGNVSGQSDTINIAANGSDTVGVFGQNQTVTGDSGNDVVNLGGDGSTATVDGGGYVGLVGNNQTLTLGNSGSSVLTAPGVQHDTIDGSGETITFANNASGTIDGSSDAINGPNGGDAITINGQNDHFSGASDNVNLEGTSYGDTVNGASNNYFDNGQYLGGSNDGGEDDWSNGGDDDDDWDPVVLNLAHASVQTVDVDQSPARFDIQDDGHPVRTGWGTPGEGYLVDVPNGRQAVSDAADLVPSFAALQSLDTNHDGVLDAHDATWSDVKVWVDTNGTAAFQAGSLQSLSDLGIVSIDLNAKPEQVADHGNTILADSSFAYADGSRGDIADVAFRFSPNQPPASAATATTHQASQTLTQAAQLVAAMSTFDVSSASDSGAQTIAPSIQASLAVDPAAVQAHRLAA